LAPQFLLLLFASALALIASGVWFLLLYRLVTGNARIPKLSPCAGQPPTVSAIVATRNEAYNIDGCLKSLLAQPEILEVIVVDDASTDSTANVVDNLTATTERIRLVRSKGPEPGWSGKSYSCHLGSLEARGEWLLFVDADTRLSWGTLCGALRHAKENSLDALSSMGLLRTPTFWQKISSPFYFGLLSSFLPPDRVNKPDSKSAYFFGSFILIRREAYQRAGGHASVKGDVVEDRALGRIAKEMGLRIGLTNGVRLISAEWGGGFDAGRRALERIAVPSVAAHPRLAYGFTFALSVLFFIPLIALTLVPFCAGTLRILLLASGLLGYGESLFFTIYSSSRLGTRRLFSFLFPFAEAVFLGILWSVALRRKKEAAWRGRRYTFKDSI